MMIERHRRLIDVRDRRNEINLGRDTTLYQKLSVGDLILFQMAGREYQMREVSGELQAHATICPHLSGPLSHCLEEADQLTCPWHGYRFNTKTGECIFPKSATCHLPPAPTETIEKEDIILNENDYLFIKKGSKHRMSNNSSVKAIIIEIQTGQILSEDDILRFKDKYERE